MTNFLLRMDNISKAFPGVKALKDVDFTLRKGEVMGLVGENGAGKSTLMNVLGGVLKQDSGNIYIDNEKVEINSVHDAENLGIAFIHQEIALVPYLSIAENIFLGRELTVAGMVNQKKMYKAAKKWLDLVGLKISPMALVHNLSIAEQQLVEIAKASSLNMKLIIMDEPTSSLSDNETEYLYNLIGKLKKEGISIIYISHKLSEIFHITDRICVLRDGMSIGEVETSKSTEPSLVKMMVGRELTNYYTRTYNIPGKTLLEVNNVDSGKRVNDCSFTLKEGEILGLYGLVGAGRSELIKSIMGLYPMDKGKVLLKGTDITKMSTLNIQKLGLALVPEDRKTEGLILKQTIKFNATLAVLDKFIKNMRVNYKKENEITDHAIDSIAIRTPSRNQVVNNLSGGNQQKVVIGKWLASNPSVLVLDEPTRGIDIGAKSEIYSIMNELVDQGIGIIMISSEMPEIINMCDRILVMSEGKIRKELSREEFDQQTILHYAVAEDL